MPTKLRPDYGDEEMGSNEGSATSTLPKSMLMGKSVEVGDTLTFKVTQVYDDEIAVEPVAETETESEPEPSEEVEMESPEESETPMGAESEVASVPESAYD